MGAVGEIVTLAAAVHRPIVGRRRHIGEHRGVDVVGENAVEDQVGRTARRSEAAASTELTTKSRRRSTASLRLPGFNPSVWSIAHPFPARVRGIAPIAAAGQGR